MIGTTAREALRHALHRGGLDRLLLRRRVARGQDVGHLSLTGRAEVFTYIYDRAVWRNGADRGPLSGVGSGLAATAGTRERIERMLPALGARTLLDVGCGDFTWMADVDLGGIGYVGVDIVAGVIAENQRRHGSPHRQFRHLDAVSEPLPAADVVLCREVLFHLSFADGRRLLHNIRRSGATYLLATSDPGTRFNADIRSGDFRIVNLRARPYRFPAPLEWIPDGAVSSTRGLGLWRAADLTSADPTSADPTSADPTSADPTSADLAPGGR